MGQPSYEEPAAYSYQYGVNDDYSGANYNADESRDGYSTKGSYSVALPDGRLQTVNYNVADGYSGYIADVTYSGEARYDAAPAYKPVPVTVYKPAPAPAYKPAPVYVAAPAPVYKAAPAPAPVYEAAPVPVYAPVPAPAPSYTPAPAPVYKAVPAPVYKAAPVPVY